jgi:exonuclease III
LGISLTTPKGISVILTYESIKRWINDWVPKRITKKDNIHHINSSDNNLSEDTNHTLQLQVNEFLEQQKSEFLAKKQSTDAMESDSNLKKHEMETNLKNTIKICTHNIRGINRLTDQDNILQEIKKQEIDIMGLSETKLTSRVAAFSFKDQDEYKTFHSCNDEAPFSAGVTLLVHKSLAKNIHRINRIEGHILVLHLHFKGKRKLCIIQIYLPSNKHASNELQKQIQKIIKREKLVNTNIIIMGDFNAVNNPLTDRSSIARDLPNNPKRKWKPESELFPYLEDIGFSDVQKNWEEMTTITSQPSHTWKNNNASSRIDYM